MQYGMVIDTQRCYGCNACAIACKLNNNLPNNVWWNTVLTEGGATRDTASGEWPDNAMRFFPKACQHCRKPLCVASCPTGASQKGEDGIVFIDQELCIGCGTCLTACPYEVRTIMQDESEYHQEVALGQWDAPEHKAGKAEKCTLCSNLLGRGKEPACVRACSMHARIFGDLDDPDSNASKALAKGRDCVRLGEESGAEPSVYYLQ